MLMDHDASLSQLSRDTSDLTHDVGGISSGSDFVVIRRFDIMTKNISSEMPRSGRADD